MSNETERVIEKVRKLLALATSSNPNEAASAAAKAQALMFEYNLSAAQVADKPSDPLAAYVQDWSIYQDSRADRIWQRALMTTVAHYNFCKAVYVSGTGGIGLIGKRENVDFVRLLFRHLCEQLEPMMRAAWAEAKRKGTRTHWLRYRNSFYQGAISTIQARLIEQRRADEAQGAESRALVVVSEAELRRAMRRLVPNSRADRRGFFDGQRSAYDGYGEGQRAGSRASLSPVAGQLE